MNELCIVEGTLSRFIARVWTGIEVINFTPKCWYIFVLGRIIGIYTAWNIEDISYLSATCQIRKQGIVAVNWYKPVKEIEIEMSVKLNYIWQVYL